jgi:hypothetical protein
MTRSCDSRPVPIPALAPAPAPGLHYRQRWLPGLKCGHGSLRMAGQTLRLGIVRLRDADLRRGQVGPANDANNRESQTLFALIRAIRGQFVGGAREA